MAYETSVSAADILKEFKNGDLEHDADGKISLKVNGKDVKIATLTSGKLEFHDAPKDLDETTKEMVHKAQAEIYAKAHPDKKFDEALASTKGTTEWERVAQRNDKDRKFLDRIDEVLLTTDGRRGRKDAYDAAKLANFTNLGDGKFYKDIPLLPRSLNRFLLKKFSAGKVPDLEVRRAPDGAVSFHTKPTKAAAKLLFDLVARDARPGDPCNLVMKDSKQLNKSQKKSIDQQYLEAYKRGLDFKILDENGKKIEPSKKAKLKQLLSNLWPRVRENRKIATKKRNERIDQSLEEVAGKRQEFKDMNPAQQLQHLLNRDYTKFATRAVAPTPIVNLHAVTKEPVRDR